MAAPFSFSSSSIHCFWHKERKRKSLCCIKALRFCGSCRYCHRARTIAAGICLSLSCTNTKHHFYNEINRQKLYCFVFLRHYKGAISLYRLVAIQKQYRKQHGFSNISTAKYSCRFFLYFLFILFDVAFNVKKYIKFYAAKI